jgi:2,5-diketo-D-gluconate reductase A
MEYVTLSNGVEMPILGYGTYLVNPKECENLVLEAIANGYRSIDTAQAYYNEEGVGNAISKCGVPREELFLTTKVWVSEAGYKKAKASIDESLRKLQTDYVDLLLIHQPYGDYYGTWRAMEEAYKEGKVRAIGLSNFAADRFIDLVTFSEVTPVMNQLETHIFQQQKFNRRYLEKYGALLEAWSPLARGEKNMFSNPYLLEVGKKYNKSASQVALRFLVQSGIVTLVKSSTPEHMKENIDIFDFVLSEEEMKTMEDMDEGVNFFMKHDNPEHMFNFFGNYGFISANEN